MEELSLYSTVMTSYSFTNIPPIRSLLSEIPKMAIGPIKPSGFSPIGQAFGSSPSLPGGEEHCPSLLAAAPPPHDRPRLRVAAPSLPDYASTSVLRNARDFVKLLDIAL